MHCKKCKVCQLFKADTQKLAGFYKPLPIPQILWEQIHINFHSKSYKQCILHILLPFEKLQALYEDNGYGTIMICIDHLSMIVVLVLL